MSRLPRVDKKPKNNKSTKFRWVDSQWEKFMTEQKELKARILELEMENAELKDMVLDLGGEYEEDEEDNQLSFDFEIANDKGNCDFEGNYGRRVGDEVREQFNRECD